MKKVILFSFIVLTTIISSAQTQESAINEKNQKSLLAVKYRLYPTQNMWTFIKLNTRNGKMWQIQFDVEDNNRFETYLNILPLVSKEKEVNDRFTLYPTQNMWTFILLDQYNGKTWQVQWSIEPENRGIVPIE
jgi:hypothetical protein